LFCANCGAKANVSASEPDPTGEKTSPGFNARAEDLLQSLQRKGFFESLQTKGFFESLFDFSFTSLITTKLIRFQYAVSMVVLAVGLLLLVIAAVKAAEGTGLLILFVGAPLFLLGICFMRLSSELFIVIFRIAEHTAEIAQQGRIKQAPAEMKSNSE
jgi:hypothetical protein